MKFIYAEYNMYHNSVDVTTFDGYILRIDCNVAEDGLQTTPCSQCAPDAFAIDEPLEIMWPQSHHLKLIGLRPHYFKPFYFSMLLLYLSGQDLKTAEYVSTRANRTVDSILGMGLEQAYLFTRGEKAKLVEKVNPFEEADTETEEWEGQEDDVEILPF